MSLDRTETAQPLLPLPQLPKLPLLDGQVQVDGIVSSQVFVSPEADFAVLRLDVAGQIRPVVAVGALAGPLGIAATTDISAVVVGNPAPYALTNPVWIRTGDHKTWQPPGVVPWAEINSPTQDPQIGVLRSHNH